MLNAKLLDDFEIIFGDPDLAIAFVEIEDHKVALVTFGDVQALGDYTRVGETFEVEEVEPPTELIPKIREEYQRYCRDANVPLIDCRILIGQSIKTLAPF